MTDEEKRKEREGVRESRDYGEDQVEGGEDATLLERSAEDAASARSRASSFNFDFSSRLVLNPSSIVANKRASDEPIGIGKPILQLTNAKELRA